jgi:3alpha(or 20beta)-hydroxysteroid dehydrogenase
VIREDDMTDSTDDFTGKRFLVTGAGRGQGAATVRLLSERGAVVIAGDVDLDAVTAVAAGSERIQPVRLDVSRREDWEAAVDGVQTLDGLVNNAGIFAVGGIEDFDVDVADRLYRVNQLGMMLGIATTRPLLSAVRGSIVNISSTAGVRGVPGRIAYAATKWAVRGLSRAAAVELAPEGVRVNCVVPGLIDTPMAHGNSPEDLAAFTAMIPLGRMGEAHEVAEATIFLLSARASYITGGELIVGGGDGA